MTAITTWRTDEPCPVCATGLIMHDDGTSPDLGGVPSVRLGRHLDQRPDSRR
jgi:hypothetical protein